MKKIWSVFLSFTILASMFSTNAFAYGKESQMQSQRTELHECIKEQLIAQDALYLMDFYDSVIENLLISKYNNTINSTAASSWYAPNGGIIWGRAPNIEVEAAFFNKSDAKDLQNDMGKPNAIKVTLEFLLGAAWFPIGALFTFSELARAIAYSDMWGKIDTDKEGCCVYATYDTLEMKTITVIFGWTPPTMSVNSTITVTDHYIKPY